MAQTMVAPWKGSLTTRTGAYLGPAVKAPKRDTTTAVYASAGLDVALKYALDCFDVATGQDVAEIISDPLVKLPQRLPVSSTNGTFISFCYLDPAPNSQLSVVEDTQPSVVEEVEALSTLTSLSIKRVLSAVGISHRTFYAWKTDKRAPRQDSLGHLRPVVQVVEGLVHDYGEQEVHTAFTADPSIRQLFEARKFDEVVMRFAVKALAEPGLAATGGSPSAAIGPDPTWMPPRSKAPSPASAVIPVSKA